MAGQKKAVPSAVRRELARAYGAEVGSVTDVRCAYCPTRGRIFWDWYPSWPMFDLEIDHVVPEHLGGLSVVENLVLACRRCNRSKGHKTLEQWLAVAA